jgi:iron-sulfur cluster insertion protein
LRVFVQGGGSSGFQFGFTFDEVVNEKDTTVVKNGEEPKMACDYSSVQ